MLICNLSERNYNEYPYSTPRSIIHKVCLDNVVVSILINFDGGFYLFIFLLFYFFFVLQF